MSDLKVGDRVKLVSLNGLTIDDYDPEEYNTIGDIGVVIHVVAPTYPRAMSWYIVDWDSGSSDYYPGVNLRKLSLDMRNK